MKRSIRKQLTVIFSLLIATMFLANYFINSTFLESFYYAKKQEVLVEAYRILNENIDDMGRLDDEEEEELND
ncbi:MAG: hypothetical protein LUI07_04705, partial [Lachnospiraceae bacterium]|nr:hypothetical protein [Lachnospiraceae bacterium]